MGLRFQKVIILKNREQINSMNYNWRGIYSMKMKYLENSHKDTQIEVINVEEWKKMNETD